MPGTMGLRDLGVGKCLLRGTEIGRGLCLLEEVTFKLRSGGGIVTARPKEENTGRDQGVAGAWQGRESSRGQER